MALAMEAAVHFPAPTFRFDDRADAGHQLATHLAEQLMPLHRPLLLAIPRGALPIAAIVADTLHGELDVVLVHKLGAPFDPEYAIGAIDEHGNRELAPQTDPHSAWLQDETARQLAVLRQRRALFSNGHAPADPCGRTVIVIDDGLATGATMACALRAIRRERPLTLIAAVPVAAPAALESIHPLADRVLWLAAPDGFRAVSPYYRSFPQVDEDEAVAAVRARSMIDRK
jgi:putative phosphoribosyl transferase